MLDTSLRFHEHAMIVLVLAVSCLFRIAHLAGHIRR